MASQTASVSSTSSSSRRLRSSPISILRPGEEGSVTSRRASGVVDSDDDDDIFCVEVSALSLKSGGNNSNNITNNYVGSVPTKSRGIRRRQASNSNALSQSLPGAPLLASRSIGFREGDDLPPISLTNNTESSHEEPPSYGSLRESHLEGKFLDGPASYRDYGGQIHVLRHNQPVRLDDSATSYHAPSGIPALLPPQNRIQSSRKEGMSDWCRVAPGEEDDAVVASASKDQKMPATTSTLSSLMQGDLPPQVASTAASSSSATMMNHVMSSPFRQDEVPHQEEGMLSTSLTGLEILQSRRGKLLLDNFNGMPVPLSTIPHAPPASLPGTPPGADMDPGDDEFGDDLFELDME